jgi:hypothetical protein
LRHNISRILPQQEREVRHTYRFYEIVVRDLREQMMDNMCPNIMMDIIEPSIISVNCGQTTSHVIPFLVLEGKHTHHKPAHMPRQTPTSEVLLSFSIWDKYQSIMPWFQ